MNRISHHTTAFAGFASPTSNTLYCPNQFFDVCLPHRSRGCVRIVAYMLRKTLGWSDAQGNPLHEQVTFTYDELIREANVSRDSIKPAVAEAEQFGFIRCLRKPSPHRAGKPAVSGEYELRWDEGREYIKNPGIFSGFFAGEGNRTYVPNQYFDVVVRHEPLVVAKVVGSIARLSIGFVNKFGHRRQHVALSMTHIQRYARIASRTKLAEALEIAKYCNYVQLVEAGRFDRNGGRSSRPATYALKWLKLNVQAVDGQKSVPAIDSIDRRSEMRPGNGRKSSPAQRSEKCPGLETTDINNISKQQRLVGSHRVLLVSHDSIAACFQTLRGEGFDDRVARQLAERFSVDQVLNQIEWLSLRAPAKNRLGLLRRAIENSYPKPEVRLFGRPNNSAGDDDPRQRLAYKLTIKPR